MRYKEDRIDFRRLAALAQSIAEILPHLQASGIADGRRGGSVDVHSSRVTITTLRLEGGANPKTVQTILERSAHDVTVREYAKDTDRSKQYAICEHARQDSNLRPAD